MSYKYYYVHLFLVGAQKISDIIVKRFTLT
jgi:hypothetical protein